MKIKTPEYNNISHKGISSFIESRVLINKALVDASIDIPWVVKSNNSDERRERLSRAGIGWCIGFATPFITLPVTNRLALKGIAKTYKSFLNKENNIIQISNSDLATAPKTEQALKELAEKYKFSPDDIIKKCGGYEKFRKRMINSKTAVRAFDYLFTAGCLGAIGYFNNWMTKKKTGRSGFSAEFNMAEKSIIEKRAEGYKKREMLMKTSFASLLTLLCASTLITRKALLSNSQKGILGKLNKHSHLFDYDDGILMKRLPMFLTMMAAYYGVASASRNSTEMKDNLIRSSIGGITFFGGDILIGILLAQISDKFFNTKIINKECEQNFINKILPPHKHLKVMSGRDRKVGTLLFWINMASLSAIIGFGVPAFINKMILKDVEKAKSDNQGL